MASDEVISGPLSPSNIPAALPQGYTPAVPSALPPGYGSDGQPAKAPSFLDGVRDFVQNTVDPTLGAIRTGASDLVKGALPILSPPAVQAGQGPLGGSLLSGAVDMLNPLPGDTSDLLRDAAFLAIPGTGGIRSALRVGAGTAGAMAGANLSGKNELAAGATSIPGLILGEGTRGLTAPIGRAERQAAADTARVTDAFNAASPGFNLPQDVQGLYQKTFAAKGQGNIKDVYLKRYQDMLDTVESKLPDPDKVMLTLPDGSQATFREAMDYIAKGSNAGKKAQSNTEPAASTRQRSMEIAEVRKGIVDVLRQSDNPQEQALAPVIEDATKQYFIDKTVHRILQAPGVLNNDTGLWEMRPAQEAFQKLLKNEMIPGDVYESFQKALWRNAKPPQMDMMAEPNFLQKSLYGMAGAVTGSKAGHPIMGYHAGLNLARRHAGGAYVGDVVGPSPLSQAIGKPVSLGSAQTLKELLSGLQ